MAIEQQIRGAGGMVAGALTPGAVNHQASYITSSEILQWVKEGRVFNGIDGVLTTPATFTNTALVRQQPDLMVRVPAGVVIIPIFAQIVYEATGGTLLEALVSVCDNDPGTSNVSAVTPTNVNTRFAGNASRCTVYKAATGATGTAPTNVSDLFRAAHAVDFDAGASNLQEQIVYSPFAGRGMMAIVGSASTLHAFLVYAACGTSSTGFVLASWAEFTYAEFYGS